MNSEKIDEAAVAAALVFKDEKGMTVTELEQLAARVQKTIQEFFNERRGL